MRGKTPVLASLFGDVFLRAADGYWFLDTIEGTLEREWASREEVQRALETDEGQDRYLLGGLATSAAARGLVLSEKQVYAFEVPPILGGPVSIDNVTVMDFVVSVNIAGQIHGQIKDVPPGTAISGITVTE